MNVSQAVMAALGAGPSGMGITSGAGDPATPESATAFAGTLARLGSVLRDAGSPTPQGHDAAVTGSLATLGDLTGSTAGSAGGATGAATAGGAAEPVEAPSVHLQDASLSTAISALSLAFLAQPNHETGTVPSGDPLAERASSQTTVATAGAGPAAISVTSQPLMPSAPAAESPLPQDHSAPVGVAAPSPMTTSPVPASPATVTPGVTGQVSAAPVGAAASDTGSAAPGSGSVASSIENTSAAGDLTALPQQVSPPAAGPGTSDSPRATAQVADSPAGPPVVTTSAAESAGAGFSVRVVDVQPVSSPTTATAPATSTTPNQPPNIAAQVGSQLSPALLRSLDNGTHRLIIRIDPEALGPVRVVAEVRDGSMQVRLHATTEAGQAALAASFDDVRQDLARVAPTASLELGNSTTGNGRHSNASDLSGGFSQGEGRHRDGSSGDHRDTQHRSSWAATPQHRSPVRAAGGAPVTGGDHTLDVTT